MEAEAVLTRLEGFYSIEAEFLQILRDTSLTSARKSECEITVTAASTAPAMPPAITDRAGLGFC